MRHIVGYDLLAVHKCFLGPNLLTREQTECQSALQRASGAALLIRNPLSFIELAARD